MNTPCLCRVCLSTKSLEYIEMEAPLSTEKTYLDCFNKCTQLNAKSDDKLPSMLCSQCAQDLQRSYEFITKALEADNVLRNRLSASEKVVQILSPTTKDFETADIENMEIVVLKSLEEQIVESTLPEEKIDDENSTYIIDEITYCSEDEADHILENHEKNTSLTKDSTWKCRECKRLFDKSVSYEDHMNWHTKLHAFNCIQCSKNFRTQNALERHKNLRHKTICSVVQKPNLDNSNINGEYVALIPCMSCNKAFATTEMLQLHEKLKHNSKHSMTCCPLCHKNFPSDNTQILNDHLNVEHSVEGKIYDFAEDLTGHYEIENSDIESIEYIKSKDTDKLSMLQECNFCKKKLLARNIEKHLKLHTMRQENFLCAYCPRHFKNQKSVRQHEKTHFEESEDILYVCAICDRQYSTENLLDQHRKNTHKEREHVCSICGNAFKLKNQLTNHMKLHLDKKIQCPHCDKKYARQFDLNVHLRSHTGEMPYQCHLCEKRFAIKVRLTYHLQKHYGVKHTCKECAAQFNSKQKLKAHSFKHTGMPYRCELCDDHGFPNRDVFKRHLLRVHQATISEEALLEMFQRNTGKTTRIREISVSLEDENEVSQEEAVTRQPISKTKGQKNI